MQDNDERTVDRRRLLRRAGAVAAGVAGAGVASAVVASPAQAADNTALTIGVDNTGGTTATTRLTAGDLDTPTLTLANNTVVNGESGAALALNAIDTTTGAVPSTAAPVGSLYADNWGDFYGVGDPDGTGKYLNLLYSPTWATMTVPVDPIRWVVTLPTYSGGRAHVSGASFDSAGRLLPKNSSTVPDMVIDFSPLLTGGYAAVQGNLTCSSATGSGWAALWGTGGAWPKNSSINFTTVPIANFTQTLLGPDMKLRVKVLKPVVIIFDIQGFVLADPFSQINPASPIAASALGAQAQRWQKRRPAGN